MGNSELKVQERREKISAALGWRRWAKRWDVWELSPLIYCYTLDSSHKGLRESTELKGKVGGMIWSLVEATATAVMTRDVCLL